MSKATIIMAMTILAAAATIFSPMAASAFPNQGDFLELKKAVLNINDHVIQISSLKHKETSPYILISIGDTVL